VFGEAVETTARSAFRESAAEHFECALSEEERIDDTVQAGVVGQNSVGPSLTLISHR
jgi:hypothetical protein